ncbi:MAG: SOS response-associated peptidase [Acidobacteria bacterium]|nr:SOS response-associated peptidase [Acidobacteriota bacterium]
MCGRFTVVSPSDVLSHFLQVPVPSLAPRYNIAPTQDVLAVVHDPEPQARALRWGLIPSWAKDTKHASRTINARGESLSEKPSFRQAFKKRRCLIPANGFYEWVRNEKRPFLFRMSDFSPFAMAGLWEVWRSESSEIHSCTIITTQANDVLKPYHDRMPVILDPAQWAIWFNPTTSTDVLQAMMAPYDAHAMDAYEVSRLVNSVSNDVPECLAPVSKQGELFA